MLNQFEISEDDRKKNEFFYPLIEIAPIVRPISTPHEMKYESSLRHYAYNDDDSQLQSIVGSIDHGTISPY
jgi:hypothetical protein